MTTHKLLLFSAINACLLISSCSWITQDHYFSNNGLSSPWKNLFRHGTLLPPTNWQLTDLNNDSTYTPIDSSEPSKTTAMKLLWARFPVSGSSLQSIKLDFGKATKNEQVIDIPNLSLTRKKGDWRINHFSF